MLTPKFKVGDPVVATFAEDEGGQQVNGVVRHAWPRSGWGQEWVEYFVDLEGPMEWAVLMEEQLRGR